MKTSRICERAAVVFDVAWSWAVVDDHRGLRGAGRPYDRAGAMSVTGVTPEVAEIDRARDERVALIDAAVQMATLHHDDSCKCDGPPPKVFSARDAACDFLRDLFVRNGTRLPPL